MTPRDAFIDKWANHLAGKFARFAFCDTTGPGVADRTRAMVKDIEQAVAKMYDELQSRQPVNGPAVPARKA